MADEAQPLFVPEKAELQRTLRLGGLVDEDAGMAVFNEAIKSARMALLNNLSQTLRDEILASPPNSSPSTDAEVRRSLAEQLETALVRYECVKNMHLAFMSGSGGARDWYNKESPYRLSSESQRMSVLQGIREDISKLVGLLCPAPGGQTVKSCSSLQPGAVKVALIGDVDTPPLDVTSTRGALEQRRLDMMEVPGWL